jgi:hypothetical protein
MAIQIGGNIQIGGGIIIGDVQAIPIIFFVTEFTQGQLITENGQELIAE